MNGDEQLELIVTPEETPPTPPPAPAEEFPFVTLPPQVTFTVRDVEPPAAAYVTPDDRLSIEARNSISGVTLNVHVRLLKPDGQIIQALYSHTPTTDRALNTWTEPLAEGFLLTCSVDAPASAKPGGCYVRALLIRGFAPVVPIGQVLLAGYVVSGSALVWPYPRYVHPVEGPGRLRKIEGTDPPAFTAIVEQCPGGARWKLLSIMCWLATSAVAGNRSVFLYFTDAGGVWLYLPSYILQPASQTYYYTWAIGITPYTPPVAGIYSNALPADLSLTVGQQIVIAAGGMDAGDNFGTPRYLVEEWIEP